MSTELSYWPYKTYNWGRWSNDLGTLNLLNVATTGRTIASVKTYQTLAQGRLFATIAGGETAGSTGTDWKPMPVEVSTCPKVEGGFSVNKIRKSYVTSAGYATHYLMLCRLEGRPQEGTPDFLMFEDDQIEWEVPGSGTA